MSIDMTIELLLVQTWLTSLLFKAHLVRKCQRDIVICSLAPMGKFVVINISKKKKNKQTNYVNVINNDKNARQSFNVLIGSKSIAADV